MRCARRRIAPSIALLAAGCAAVPPATTRLDSSGLTVVSQPEAVLLSSPVPELATAARDYAVVGPVEINRSGDLDFYLWVGLASTIDRQRQGLEPPEARALALIVDGEPMVLPLSEWQTSLDAPPYQSPAPVYETLVAHTSLDQIHRIAAAKAVDLHVVTRSGGLAHYRRWKGSWSAWSSFSANL